MFACAGWRIVSNWVIEDGFLFIAAAPLHGISVDISSRVSLGYCVRVA